MYSTWGVYHKKTVRIKQGCSTYYMRHWLRLLQHSWLCHHTLLPFSMLYSGDINCNREPFKQAHWMSFRKTSNCRWEQALFEFPALSISVCWERRVVVLRQDCLTSFLKWGWMEIRPARASIPLVYEVWNVLRIQRTALYCIITKSNTYALVGTLVKNQTQKQ